MRINKTLYIKLLWPTLAVIANATIFTEFIYANFRTNPTVCTITINSSNEKKAFQEYLGTMNYNFVELTPQTEKDKEDGEWFDKACASNVQCDVLIISGHFGGTFFGKSGLNLPLRELEKHSCNTDCSGIVSHPTEVFLFGCNTLATKDRDFYIQDVWVRALRDNIKEIKWIAAVALLDSGPSKEPRVYRIAGEMLTSRDPNERQQAVQVLRERGINKKDPEIAEMLGDAKPTPHTTNPLPPQTPPQPLTPLNVPLDPNMLE